VNLYFNDKLYYRTQVTSLNSYTISGLYNIDIGIVDISSYSAYYKDFNANYSIPIDISNIVLHNISIDPTQQTDGFSNYTVSTFNYGSNILSLPINAFGIDKIYDSTNYAEITLSGIIYPDTIIYQANFSNINIGYLQITISSFHTNNYLINNLIFSNILPKLLTANFIDLSKIYNSTYKADVLYTLSGIINDEFVDISSTNIIANYNSINVGYNTVDISNIYLYGMSSNNYIINSTSAINGYITPSPLLVNLYFNDKLYDRTQVTSLNSYTISGLYNIDIGIVDISSYSAYYRDFNSNYSIPIDISNVVLHNISIDPTQQTDGFSNYTVSTFNYGSNILSLPINAFGIDKIYDSTNYAEITLSGIIYPDIITYQANFSNINVGYVQITISGFHSNYHVNNIIYGNILHKLLTVKFIDLPRNYNSTYIANVLHTLSGIVNNDNVDISSTNIIANYNSINVGYNIVDISNIYLYGNSANNYVINSIANTFGYILPAPLLITLYFKDKLYDRTQVTSLNNYTISGLYNIDIGIVDISSYSAFYRDFNGNYLIPVDVSNVVLYNISIDPTQQTNGFSNYIASTFNYGSNILPFPINVKGSNKIYDGTSNIQVTLSGIIYSDIITYKANFNNINVGYVQITISGLNTNNYHVNNIIYGNIFSKLLTVQFNNLPKTYDSTYIANVLYTLSGIINNDNVDISSINIIANYNTINIGNSRIDISNIYLYGNSASNYIIHTIANIFGYILPAPLLITLYFKDKLYDRTQETLLNSYTISGLYDIDIGIVDISSYSAFYRDFNANNLIPIDISNVVIYNISNNLTNQANGYSNYNLLTFNYGAKILQLPITAFGTDKIYDSTINVQITLSGIIYPDSIIGVGSFVSPNIGKQIITISGLYGIGSSNYIIDNIPLALISPASLVINFYSNILYYNTNTINLTYSISGLYNIDNGLVDICSNYIVGLRSFNAGYQTFEVSNIYLYINTNYQVKSTTIGTTFINPYKLTIVPDYKTYDQTLFGTFSLSGIFKNDVVKYNNISVFNTSNVGLNIITISNYLFGYSSNNYFVDSSINAYINKSGIYGIGGNKIYDGSIDAKITFSGVYPLDVVIASYAYYSDIITSRNKLITISSGILFGAQRNNYYLINLTTSGSISIPTVLTILLSSNNITYGTSLKFNVTLTPALLTKANYGIITVIDNNNNILFTGATNNITTTTILLPNIYFSSLIATFVSSDVLYGNSNTFQNIIVNQLPILVSIASKTYDTTTNVSLLASNIISPDIIYIYGSFNSPNVLPSSIITLSSYISGNNSFNYSLQNTISTIILPRYVNTSFTVVKSRIYDGTGNTSILSSSILNLYSIDLSSITIANTCIAQFTNPYAENNKQVLVYNITFVGPSSKNYTTQSYIYYNNQNIITPKFITAYALDRRYDSTTLAKLALSGVINNDNVIPPKANYNSINIGNQLPITLVNYTLTGNLAGSYTFIDAITLQSSILPAIITPFVYTKFYDTTINARFTLSGIYSGDDVRLDGLNTILFSSPNAGTQFFSISGILTNSNYIINAFSVYATIKPYVISAKFYGNPKIYDGNSIGTASYSLSGIFASDINYIDISNTQFVGNFVNKNVGYQQLNITNIVLFGPMVVNYTISTTNSTNCNITQKSINAYGQNRFYDQTSLALISLVGVIGNDNVLPPTSFFTTINVGNQLPIILSSNILGGYQGNNYILINLTTSASILPSQITPIGNNKIYDSNLLANITLRGVFLGDNVILNGTLLFNNINIGYQMITISGYLSNPNYMLNATYTYASILSKIITPYFYVKSKTYDYLTTNAIITYTLSGILANDINNNINIGQNYYGNYRSINAGNQFVDINNINLTGAYNNYILASTNISVLGFIDRKIITAKGNDKFYDSTNVATLTLSGIIGSDLVNYYAYFNNYNVGTFISVTISSILYGPQGNNYNMTSSITTANIFQKIVTPVLNVKKVVDGTPTLVLTGSISGLFTADNPVFFNFMTPVNSVYSLGYYGIGPWSNASNFIDISAQWIWTSPLAANIAPLNTVPYQFQYKYTNLTNTFIYAIVHILSDDICDFYFNGIFINTSIIGGYNSPSYSKINIIIPVGTSLFNFECYNLGSFPNPAGVLVSVLDIYNNLLFRTDNTWVYSIDLLKVLTFVPQITFATNYYTVLGNFSNGFATATYSFLTLSGLNSQNYNISSLGSTLVTLVPIVLTVLFYSIDKPYDRTYLAYVGYTISGILFQDQGFVDICSNYLATYRTLNTGSSLNIDVNNINLYGSSAYKYIINISSNTIGNITQKYIYSTGIDRIYDATINAQISISNLILFDIIQYNSVYTSKYANLNKLINISLSNVINNTLNELTFQLQFYYSFNPQTILNQNMYNMAIDLNPKLDAILSSSGLIDTTNNYIDTGSLILQASLQQYVTLSSFITLNNGITFAFWFNSKNTGNWGKIFDFANGKLDNILFGINNNYISCGVHNSPVVLDYFNFYLVNVNNSNWIHITWILQTNKIWLFYVNGILINTRLNSIYPTSKLRINNYIGKSSNLSDAYYNGSIDEFRMYQRILSSTEITNLYTNRQFYFTNVNNNYQLYNNVAFANIFPKLLNGSFTGINRNYNANTFAQINYSISGIFAGDVVDISNNYTALFTDIYASNNKSINISNLKLIGNDYYNYIISTSGNTNANITKQPIIPIFVINKTYDQTQAIDINNYKLLVPYLIGNLTNIILVCGQGPTPISFTTNNGLLWNPTSIGSIFTIANNALWNGTIWVAVGSGNYVIATSPTGIVWTGINSTIFTNAKSIAWSMTLKLWVAVGNGLNNLAYSYDSINWIAINVNGFRNGTDIIWANSLFIATGSVIIYSSNGLDWLIGGNNLFFTPTKLSWSSTLNIFIGINNNDLLGTIISSYNGIDWIKITSPGYIFNNIFSNSSITLFNWSATNNFNYGISLLTTSISNLIIVNTNLTSSTASIIVDSYNLIGGNNISICNNLLTIDSLVNYNALSIINNNITISSLINNSINLPNGTYNFINTISSNINDMSLINNFAYGGLGYYSLKQLYAPDLGLITISSSIYGYYRNNQTNIGEYVDLSNIYLYGPTINTQNYTTLPFLTVSGNIFQKLITANSNDKIYDRTTIGNLTISGIIYGDLVPFVSNYTNINIGLNKIVNVSLLPSNYFSLNYDPTLILYYTFEPNTINGLAIANMASGLPVYNNVRAKNINMFSSDSKIGSGCIESTTQYNTQVINNITFSLNISNDFSLSFWLKSNGSFRQILYEFISGPIRFSFSYDQGFSFIIYNGNWHTIPIRGIRSFPNWTHIIWTGQYNASSNDSTYYTYINGILNNTQPNYPSPIQGTYYGNIMSGINQPHYVPSFIGLLDDFRLYNKYLTETEVKLLYNYTGNNSKFNDNNNYSLTSTIITGNIYQKVLNISFTTLTKNYNAITLGNSTYSINGIIIGDNVDINNSYITNFVDINAGITKNVNITNINLIGSSSLNYITSNINYSTGNILPARLNPIFTINKIYDRTQTSYITYSLSGVYNIDLGNVYLSGSLYGLYRDYNSNINIPVDISGIILTGPVSRNYFSVNYMTTSGNIFAKFLTISGIGKIYDQTLSASIIVAGVLPGDLINIYQTYYDNNAALAKPLNVYFIGSNSNSTSTLVDVPNNNNNYQIPYTIADIYKKELFITTVNDKYYDGTTATTVGLGGLINNDMVYYYANFSDINAGYNKSIYVTLSGIYPSSNNYYPAIGYASILQALISFVFNPANKGFDGLITFKNLTYSAINGIIGNDKIYIQSYYATYNDATIDINKFVTISSIILFGSSATNYIAYPPIVTISGCEIYKPSVTLFLDSILYTTINTSLTRAQHIYDNVAQYDYIFYINVGSLPGVGGDITRIFSQATFTTNPNQIGFYYNLNILPVSQLNDSQTPNLLFNWNDFSQQNIVTIAEGQSNYAFGSFNKNPKNIGDRLREVVAHKLFGNAKATEAISNGNNFYLHDIEIWDHLSQTISSTNIQNDIFNQYLAFDKLDLYTLGYYDIYNSSTISGATMTTFDFQFKGLTFDYPLYLTGSVLLDPSLLPNENAALSNGPTVGGTSLINASYNIPILIKFHD
jgi:hypothetical protein